MAGVGEAAQTQSLSCSGGVNAEDGSYRLGREGIEWAGLDGLPLRTSRYSPCGGVTPGHCAICGERECRAWGTVGQAFQARGGSAGTLTALTRAPPGGRPSHNDGDPRHPLTLWYCDERHVMASREFPKTIESQARKRSLLGFRHREHALTGAAPSQVWRQEGARRIEMGPRSSNSRLSAQGAR